jgi:hypothetical protein
VACNQPTTAEAPMEGLDPAGVRAEFGIPEDAEVVALPAIGHTGESDNAHPWRFSLERIAFSERRGEVWQVKKYLKAPRCLPRAWP